MKTAGSETPPTRHVAVMSFGWLALSLAVATALPTELRRLLRDRSHTRYVRHKNDTKEKEKGGDLPRAAALGESKVRSVPARKHKQRTGETFDKTPACNPACKEIGIRRYFSKRFECSRTFETAECTNKASQTSSSARQDV